MSVGAARRWQARADVEKLPDALLGGDEPHRPDEERAGGPGRGRDVWIRLEGVRARGAIGREIIFPA